MAKFWSMAVIACCYSVLSACGGSSGGGVDGVEPTTDVGETVTQTIGVGGGLVTITSNEIKATLTFPPDALATDTAVTLQSLPPVGTELLRLALKPIGVSFAKPVTITLELPATRAVKASAVMALNIGGKKIFVPTTVDVSAGRVTTEVLYFSLIEGAAPHQLASVATSAGRVMFAAAAPGEDSTTLTLEELAVLQPQIEVVEQALVDLQAEGNFAHAARLQLSLAALAQSEQVPELQADAIPMLRGASVTVCAALTQAIGVAQATPVLDYDDYRRVAKDVVYWEAASQALGTYACPGTAWNDALDAKLKEALTFIANRVKTPPAPNGYGPLGTEVGAVVGLGNEAASLRLAAAAADTRSLYVDPALTPLRAAAFASSQGTLDQSPYFALLGGFGPEQSLSDDAQYTATTFTVTSKDALGGTITAKNFGRGASVGTPVKTGTVYVKTDGTLEITGNIAVLHCPNPGTERLQILLEGFEIANISSSGDVLLGTNPTLPVLSIGAILSKAGINPQNATQHRLEIKRIDSSCITSFAIYDDVLAAVTLDFSVLSPLTATFVGKHIKTIGTNVDVNQVVSLTVTRPSADSDTVILVDNTAGTFRRLDPANPGAALSGIVLGITGNLANQATASGVFAYLTGRVGSPYWYEYPKLNLSMTVNGADASISVTGYVLTGPPGEQGCPGGCQIMVSDVFVLHRQ